MYKGSNRRIKENIIKKVEKEMGVIKLNEMCIS